MMTGKRVSKYYNRASVCVCVCVRERERKRERERENGEKIAL